MLLQGVHHPETMQSITESGENVC